MFARHRGIGWLQTGIPLLIIIFLVAYFLYLKNMSRKQRMLKTGLLLSIWCIIEITQFPMAINNTAWEHIRTAHNFKYNLEAFDAILIAFKGGYRLSIAEILVNVLMFIPFGVSVTLLSYKGKYAFLKVFSYSLLLSICVELIQLVTLYYSLNVRIFDINDILLNTLGGVLGYIIVKLMLRVRKEFIR